MRASGKFLQRADSHVIRTLFSQSGASGVIDIPVGTGRAIAYLSDKLDYAYGIDYSMPMLLEAKKKNIPNLYLIKADANKLPIRAGSVECLSCLRFFHLFSLDESLWFAKEFQRIITPGGFIICSFDNPFYGFGLGLLRKKRGKYGPRFQERGELQALFPGWRIVASLGNFLPLQRLTTRLGQLFSDRIIKFVSSDIILKNFCFERFYLLQKPA